MTLDTSSTHRISNPHYQARLRIPSDHSTPIRHPHSDYQSERQPLLDTVDDVEEESSTTPLPIHFLDSGIESICYDPVENDIFLHEAAKNANESRSYAITSLRYVVFLLIGLCTGLSAFLIDLVIENLTHYKYYTVALLSRRFHSTWSIAIPCLVWSGVNMLLTGIGAALVVFVAPVAAGSGIPQIKSYLNGINIPRVLRFRTMLVKGCGVILAVAGGLAVGKEGPMIHIGSVVAAGLSQGRIVWLNWSSRLFRPFRNDRSKRDFVGAGAAAGVAAAFGAPVGGLLFSLEEGSSFYYQSLTWDMNFDYFSALELLIFLVMGLVGGVTGALFVKLNSFLTVYRQKYVTSRVARIIEAVLTTCITTTAAFTLMLFFRNCSPIAYTTSRYQLRLSCADNEFNTLSSLIMSTPEGSLRTLFHDPPFTFDIVPLLIFAGVYFLLACVTYGTSVPSGLFIPGLLVGAAWGRVVGLLMYSSSPLQFADPGKFALIGAAAQLGGIVRMTLSLTVILMEATGNVIIGLPLLLTLTVAKYVGDSLSEGIYDEHILLNHIALLPWQPNPMSITKRAYNVMSSPVVYLTGIMQVGQLVDLITSDQHYGYPVVEGPVDPDRFSYGRLIGLIQLEHIRMLLNKKAFLDAEGNPSNTITIEDYDNAYPHYTRMEIDHLTEDDLKANIDLRPYMSNAPYTVPELRGIITRKDLRRFRFDFDGSRVRVEELAFVRQMSR